MFFHLRINDDSGNRIATLSVYANNGAADAAGYGWEWLGDGLNTGGDWVWVHDGSGYYLRLLESGYRFGSVNGNWPGPVSPNGYPPVPWFRSGDFGFGGRSVPGPAPQRLLPAFHWRFD